MGITASMGLLKFALLGVDLLGWPVIALGYPLFASIMAVETGSRYQMRKLIIYWTLFSLFSLFEFAFVKIIDWIPFWSGVRFVVSFCLVMPQFEGACLAYQGLVRSVIDRFGMLKEERLCKRETSLDVVEKYIKENGSEALQKLIASQMTQPEARCPGTPPLKKSHQKWTCDLCKITTVGESALNAHLQGNKHKSKLEVLKASLLDAKDTGSSQSWQVQHGHSFSAAWDLKGTYVAAQFKERMPPKAPENPLLKKAQQEWTCDLCNVTTASKSMLNAHLQGSKHKSNLESPKASLLDAKDTGPSPLVDHVQSVSAASDLKGTYAAAEVKGIMPPKETAEKWCPETPLLKKARQEWTCDLCKVTTTSEITLNGHLQGSKHKAKLETILKESLLDANDTGPSSPLVQQAQPIFAAWDLNGTYGAAKDREIMPPKETVEKKLPQTPLFKKAQQEWTDDLCKVTTESESTLNYHLQEGQHKAELDTTLQASLLEAKDTGLSPLVLHTQSVSATWDMKGTYAAAEVEEIMPPKETAEKRRPETPLLNKTQPEWTCDLCKVTTTSEITLNSHLHGSKHKAKLETTLKESLLGAKDSGPLVQNTESVSAGWDLNRIYAAFEDKEIMPPKETAEKSLPETPLLKKAQQEWTGDLCKVTTECESTLNDHLQGSKDKSKLEPTLEASLLDAKDTGPSPSVQQAQQAQSVSTNWDLKGMYAAAEVKEIMPPKETAEMRSTETPLLKKPKQEWTCELCKVTTTSEITLNGHLRGSKHKAKLETTLKESFLELEKLTASKNGRVICCDSHNRDVQVVESEVKYGSLALQEVQYAKSIEVPKRRDANAEVKETMPPPEASLAETPPLKKEWSCGLCKVKVTCEKNLNAHLVGSKHKSKFKSLVTWKGKLVVLEINGSFKYLCTICDVNLISDVDLVSHIRGKRHTCNIYELEVMMR